MNNVMEKYGLVPGDYIIRRLIDTISGEPDIWIAEQIFSENNDHIYVLGGIISKRDSEVLPYKGNEELVGTDNNKWNPVNELVAVKFQHSSGIEYWKPAVYLGRNADGKHVVKFHSGDSDKLGFMYADIIEPIENHFKLYK